TAYGQLLHYWRNVRLTGGDGDGGVDGGGRGAEITARRERPPARHFTAPEPDEPVLHGSSGDDRRRPARTPAHGGGAPSRRRAPTGRRSGPRPRARHCAH